MTRIFQRQIDSLVEQNSFLTKTFLNLEYRLFDLERRCEAEHLIGRDD